MSLRLKSFLAFALIFGLATLASAQPVFENRTPVGFSPSDSTTSAAFVTDKDISVLVDLNKAANSTNPVTANFQKVEKAMPYFSTASTAGYMSQAIAVDASGVIHRAWIQARGNAVLGKGTVAGSTTTPAYGVVYAKSFNGGKTFTDTVSVSGSLRFDMITPNLGMTSGYSTLDLVLDSKGNPRVVYAMDSSPDGLPGTSGASQLTGYTGGTVNKKAYNNIYLNYSNDGGSTWLPANGTVVINDTTTIAASTWPGRKCAFPRMAVTSTDDIFIVYEDGMASATQTIRLAKMDADSLKSGSARQVQVGSLGTVGSTGGIRISQSTVRGVTPDIAVGDDDVLHVVWFKPANSTTDPVYHKTVPAFTWSDVGPQGWNQNVAGATVGQFNTTNTNQGMDGFNNLTGSGEFIGSTYGKTHLFPTVVVDRARTPDRVYALWKHTDALAASPGADENIAYNTYNYDGATGANASWGSTQYAFPTGSGTAYYNTGGSGLFQQGSTYQIEGFWGFVDRIAAWVDDAVPNSRGDLHIVFSGGPSEVKPGALGAPLGTGAGKATSLYYARFNGTEWELPQVVASARNSSGAASTSTTYDDGVLATSRNLFSPDIAMRSGDANVYLTFVGGSPREPGVQIGGRASRFKSGNTTNTPGRGFAALHSADVKPLPYFKIIGRVVSYSDISVPTGAFKYLLTYNPVNPQSAALKNLVAVTAPDNVNSAGIGGATPGTSAAPGGFLTGQWRRVGFGSLGVTSLNPGDVGAVFKGAVSSSEATNDNGVFEGQADDSGTFGYAEWGDDDDKTGLMVKLNVLGSDSANNLFVIQASSAARGALAANTNNGVPTDSSTQSVNVDTSATLLPQSATFVRGITGEAAITGQPLAPMGSYFWMGANINIVATNVAPVVQVVEPDATTISSGTFGNETTTIKYVLFDSDTNVLTYNTGLQMELWAYPDKGLRNVQDIRTFATRIVDEEDNTTVTLPAGGTNTIGTNDFTEGTSSTNVQTYTWDDPGSSLRALGFAPITGMLDGSYFIYLVADDLVNPPVFAVSAGAMKIRHIPLVKSLAPVGSDTVDTGEISNLSKTNPYKVNFLVKDYDDNAQMRLFFSTNANIPRDSVKVTGTFPSLTLSLGGASPIQKSDTLRSEEDVNFSFDVTAQGANRDSVIAQGSYTIYTVVSDGDSTVLASSSKPLSVRHSPSFEFTSPLVGTVNKLNTTQQDRYTLEWQRGRSDRDLDGNAIISLYYIGIDPQRKSFSGTDSTALIDSGAVLIKGSLREDSEGGGDQFVWDFRNPPGALPKTFRPKSNAAAGTNISNPYIYQNGRTTDTAWVYAVLHDTLGNTRVSNGGAVLLLGSQQSAGSPAPKVTMRTPSSGGQTITNGDVVRLEWDAFLIDDGTGTDDAYLRLYAAPKGLYTTLTQLEGNNTANGGQVILINSYKGRDDVAAQITTLRESGNKYLMWDTKTHSFGISGTPIEYDIFIAGSVDPQFGDNVYVNGRLDSIATGVGSQAQRAVLSKAPGSLKVVGTDPIFSAELGPGTMTATSGDTLSMDVLVNSEGSSINLMDLHLNVPRRYFEVVDMDTTRAGLQPFADSTGAFQSASTIVQNDTTAGTDQFIKLNFVESVILGEAIGRTVSPFDSSQVAARMKLKVKRYTGGAPLDTVLAWSSESGRRSMFYQNSQAMAFSGRDGQIKIVPRARIIATVPLEGRPSDYADTLDAHLRLIGSTNDITDTTYIAANDVKKVYVSGVLQDSVNVVSNSFGVFTLTEVPPGTYELTVKARGYISGRSDTLRLFNGSAVSVTPTFGSDALGALSPATALAALRGGDATGDNQVDIADANLIFSRWNLTPSSSSFVRDADFNKDNVINSLDLVLVTTNFGNDGYGAPPVFKRTSAAGDNSSALVELEGVEEVEKWWPGRTFELKAKASGMQDVAGYGFTLTYDPEKVKPLGDSRAVTEGGIFKANPRGSLFYQQVQPGVVEVTAGRIGREWSASGEAELAVIRFVALGDDPGQLEIASGELVNSDFRGVPMRVKKAQPLPMVAALHQNYPNPFNPSTEIRFDLPTARDVKLTIYNQLGQSIRTLVDRRMKAGAYALKWDGTDNAGQGVASGVYFYSIEAGDFSQIRKMTLVK